MAHNGVTRLGKIVGICVGITVLLAFVGGLVAEAVVTRSTTRNNKKKIATLETKIDFIYDQSKEQELRKRIEDSLKDYTMMVKIDSIVKVNGDSTPD